MRIAPPRKRTLERKACSQAVPVAAFTYNILTSIILRKNQLRPIRQWALFYENLCPMGQLYRYCHITNVLRDQKFGPNVVSTDNCVATNESGRRGDVAAGLFD